MRTTAALRSAPESDVGDAWHDGDDLRWAARHWATRIGVTAPVVQLRQMRSKWASISTTGRLSLNTDLLALPRRLGEFVIVHELLHLIVPSHGRVFKSFLYAYLPDWEDRERELRAGGSRAGGRGPQWRLSSGQPAAIRGLARDRRGGTAGG